MYYDQQRYKGKERSNLILILAVLGAIMFAAGVVMHIVDVADVMFKTTNIAIDCFAKLFIVAAGVIFALYYLVFYSKNQGNMLIPATFTCVAVSSLIKILSIVIGVIDTANKGGGNAIDLFVGSLPSLTAPVIIAILFGIVALNFVTGKFSMIIFVMALAFVIANYPQEIVSQLVGLIQSKVDDKSPQIFELMRTLGEASVYTSVLVFGVKEARK